MMTINFFIPFVMLLSMNIVIVHALRTRGRYFKDEEKNEARNAENRQLTFMLLAIATGFLILCSPQYMRLITYTIKSNSGSPYEYALYILAVHTSQTLINTNNAINFFLYCISGSKFRKDLISLFRCGSVRSAGKGELSGTKSTGVAEASADQSITQN